MRGKVDPQITQEISARFVEMVEQHLRLEWQDAAKILGYSNRSTLDAVRDGRTIPGPDKLFAISRWRTPDGKRANIDWLFSNEGEPVISTSKLDDPVRKMSQLAHADLMEIEQLSCEGRKAVVTLIRALKKTNSKR
ncbi:hypothetical protein [Rugamonas aquatica]|uniref:Uncharacterized protein n=1 Tax=Rugamonas aquatica TaxID=2743357 RepID=A0A6A7N0F5_9BURK|nr:hypothetical protein [Rugamonas aquatica]MQA38513.1 hypothetical protein [Rugamonas aquatica]